MKPIHKAVLGMLLFAFPVFCGLSGSLPLSTLLSQADAVVVATIDAGDASYAASTATVDLTAQRVLKGSVPVQSTFRAEWPHDEIYTGTPNGNGKVAWAFPPGKTAIWFLQRTGSSWHILPLVSGSVSFDDLYISVPNGDLPTAYKYDVATDPKRKLVLELEAAAMDPKTSDVTARVAFLGMDDGLGADNLQSLNDALASSSQTAPKLIGLAGQIRAGRPGSIAKFAAMSRSTIPMNLRAFVTMAVCEYRGTEASAVPGLAHLAESASSTRMQECAAHALREIHTKETLPFLRKLLDDPDGNIRYDAMIGIAQFAMNFPVAKAGHKIAALSNFNLDKNVTDEMTQHYPAMDLFAKDEGQYISYWKDWLNSHPVQ